MEEDEIREHPAGCFSRGPRSRASPPATARRGEARREKLLGSPATALAADLGSG